MYISMYLYVYTYMYMYISHVVAIVGRTFGLATSCLSH